MRTRSTDAASAEIYEYCGKKVRAGKYFVYETTVYKVIPGGFSLLNSRLYYSTKLYTYSQRQVFNRDGYDIVKYIDLIRAPREFLISNGTLYEDCRGSDDRGTKGANRRKGNSKKQKKRTSKQ